VPANYPGHEPFFGRVTFTAAAGDPLRVPFHLVARPFGVLDVPPTVSLANAVSAVAAITATHSGPLSPSLWAYPALVASEAPNPAIARQASIRLFGMDYGGHDGAAGDLVGIAIQTWSPSPSPQPGFAEFDLYVDPDDDGEWEYVLFNANLGSLSASNDNTWVVLRYDREQETVAMASPFIIYGDYNSALMEWLVPSGGLGLQAGDTAFGYMLTAFDRLGASDVTIAGVFDYAAPPLRWAYDGDPPPGGSTMFRVWARRSDDCAGTGPVGLMIVDRRGDPTNSAGSQAYLVRVLVRYAYPVWFPFMAGAASP
jgi:hypothetical protein